jgi:hypothetical protein
VKKSGRVNNIISTKPRPRPRALAFPKPRPGQKPTQAKFLAWLGPAFFGLAWPGFWLQAGAGTSLNFVYSTSTSSLSSSNRTVLQLNSSHQEKCEKVI